MATTTQQVTFPADLAANLAGIALQGRDLNWASSTIRNKINQLLAAAAAEMNTSTEPAPVQLDGDRECPCNPKTDACGCPRLPIRECRCYRDSLDPDSGMTYPYRDETSAVSR